MGFTILNNYYNLLNFNIIKTIPYELIRTHAAEFVRVRFVFVVDFHIVAFCHVHLLTALAAKGAKSAKQRLIGIEIQSEVGYICL